MVMFVLCWYYMFVLDGACLSVQMLKKARISFLSSFVLFDNFMPRFFYIIC